MALTPAQQNTVILMMRLAERLLELKTAIETIPLKYGDELYPAINTDQPGFNADLASIPDFAHLVSGELINAAAAFNALVAWGGEITDAGDPWARLNAITQKPAGL